MGGSFNDRLLFKSNRLLLSLLFSGNCCGEDKALMEGDKVVIGGSPTGENPAFSLNVRLHDHCSVKSLVLVCLFEMQYLCKQDILPTVKVSLPNSLST